MPILGSKAADLVAGLDEHLGLRDPTPEERAAFEAKLTIRTKDRPDELWWVRLDEGMSMEPACIEFDGDAPAKVQVIGDDSWGGTRSRTSGGTIPTRTGRPRCTAG